MVKLTTILNYSSATQRVLAMSLLFVACLLTLGSGYLAISNFRSNTQAIVEKRFTLGRLESVAGLKSALENQTNPVANSDTSRNFLEGTSEAVILADLQGRLNAMATTHKVTVQSVGNLPIRTNDQIRFAGIATDVHGSDEAVHALLYDIETSTPYLVIRKVTLRSTIGGPGAKGPPQISARIEFFGALPPTSQEAGL